MKTRILTICAAVCTLLMCAGCNNQADNSSDTSEVSQISSAENESSQTEQSESSETSGQNGQVASPDESTTPIEVVEDGMVPVYADSFKDGEYSVAVSSSSSMFRITECTLKVENGKMTADMTMSGKGYLYLFMGTGEEAVKADSSQYIPFEEVGDTHHFTVPVNALDEAVPCSAFSKNKEKWYDRTLLFRLDSMPETAFAELTDVKSLGLADGEYTVDVALSGGSGRTSVQSPAKLKISGDTASAEIVWSSNKFDYMVVNEEKILPVSTEEFSVFEIPVSVFDIPMAVRADTTAMSQPHEIEYTLKFDSSTIKQ